jgi:putative transposase
MVLSDFGKIVKTEWNKSFEIRAELFCDEYKIMPNHLHAIVVIEKLDENIILNGGNGDNENIEMHGHIVETHGRASLRANHPQHSQHPQHPFHRKPKSLSSFIAGFKSATNTKIDDYIDNHQLNTPKYNKNNHFWQPNYHDRVIRNQQEYNRIKQYIINNPKNWTGDKFNPNNG